jgi:hypothetical protein
MYPDSSAGWDSESVPDAKFAGWHGKERITELLLVAVMASVVTSVITVVLLKYGDQVLDVRMPSAASDVGHDASGQILPPSDPVLLTAIGGSDRNSALAYMSWVTERRGGGANLAGWEACQRAAVERGLISTDDPRVFRCQRELAGQYGIFIRPDGSVTYEAEGHRIAAERVLRVLRVE